MIRVVIDTNPLVAAFINPRGYPARIISAWREGEFQIIVSPTILKEYERVFFFPDIRKMSKLGDAEIYDLLALLTANTIVVPGVLDLRVVKQDPSDDKFFIAAVEGNSEYIITKEQRWKKLKTYRGIRIVSPSKFYEILKKRRKGDDNLGALR